MWAEVLAPATLSTDHPAFLAFVPGAPSKASVLFDLVISASATYGGSWIEGAGAVWAENEVLRWLAEVVGMPGGSGGAFVSRRHGGEPLGADRGPARGDGRRGGDRPARWRIASADTVHSSVASAARVMDADVLAVPNPTTGPPDRRRARGVRSTRRTRATCSPSSRAPGRRTPGSSTTSRASPTSARNAGCGSTSTARTAARRCSRRASATGSAASSARTRSSSTRTSGCSRRSTRARSSTRTRRWRDPRTARTPRISTR